MDLNEFNTRVLGALDIADTNDSGHLSRVKHDGSTEPFMIGKKRVVLPTQEHLRSNNDNTIVYHPLSENITRSESDMIKALRDTIMFKLTINAVSLITELGRVAATDSEHGRLDSESSAYLKVLREMDEKSYEFLRKVTMRIGSEPEKRLISISLRKGDKADGVKRSVKFVFPVLDQMLEDPTQLLGMKYPSKKVRANLIALFEIVLGNAEERAAYDFGSKNLTAPYFHALFTGFYNVASRLNEVVKKHKKLLGPENVADMTIDLSWYEAMDELADLRKKVPPQEGNVGAIIVAEPEDQERVRAKMAERLAPRARELSEERSDREERQPSRKEELDLPWDDDTPGNRSQAPARQQPRREGKSLDDYLSDRRGGGGRDRDYDRGYDRGGRGYDRGRDRDYDRGGRDRFGGGRPAFDLGLQDRDREERGGRFASRDFRREERPRDRRPAFGSGHSRSGY